MSRAGSGIGDDVVGRLGIEVIACDQARSERGPGIHCENCRSAGDGAETRVAGDDCVCSSTRHWHIWQSQGRIRCARQAGAIEPPLVRRSHIGRGSQEDIVPDKSRLTGRLDIETETWRSDYGNFRSTERAVVKPNVVQRPFETEPITVVRQAKLDLLTGRPGPRYRIGLKPARGAVNIDANVTRVRLIVNVSDMM